MSIALSVLTKRPIRIVKIRAGRKKGGLASQHLKGIELVREMCNGNLKGNSIGSSEIEFHPSNLKGGEYTADAITAGYNFLI